MQVHGEVEGGGLISYRILLYIQVLSFYSGNIPALLFLDPSWLRLPI